MAFFILAKTDLKSVKNKILFELDSRFNETHVTIKPREKIRDLSEFILFSFLSQF